MQRPPIHIAAGREADFAARLTTAPVPPRGLALSFPPSVASRAELLVGGDDIYPVMLRDIEAATSSIHIDQFGFRPGVVGDRFAAALASKARAGLPVRLLVDGRGSRPERSSRALYRELVAAGVDVGVTWAVKPWASRGRLGSGAPAGWNLGALGQVDHRKFLVIDGRIGWVGGAGVEDRFLGGGFPDLFVRVEGSVVRQLQLVFLVSLRRLGLKFAPGEVPALLPEPELAGPQAVPVSVLDNGPGSRRISAAIERAIDGARETLDVANPYLSDRPTIARLRAASRRGVRVRLLVPSVATGRVGVVARHAYHAAMLADGIEVWGHPAMVHAKALVRDGQELLLGSCNLEVWSLRRFLDLNLRIESPTLARAVITQFFEPNVALSHMETPPAGILDRLVSSAYAAAWPLI